MSICVFCGNREIYENDVKLRVEKAMRKIIEKGCDTFYSGGMGEFDSICERSVRKLKCEYNIKLVLVLPCMTNRLNSYGEYYSSMYDEVLIIDTEGHHYKERITVRNRKMVDCADYIICYEKKGYGGACNTKKYAMKKGKKIFDV